MAKFAMHNDPKMRKAKYDEEKVSGAGHNARRMEPEDVRFSGSKAPSMTNSIAGGAAWQAMRLNEEGTTDRGQEQEAGISIFDPVLCELAYRWFSPKGGVVLDPFAGGSVRGIVASKLGRNYVGCELRQEQVDENRVQGSLLCADPMPVWACGDSMDIQEHCAGVEADMIFSCPPYADLEVYSDDPKDISNMPYDKFMAAYTEIIKRSCAMLKQDRFAVFVIGEVRSKKKGGAYVGFVPDTIKAFKEAGLDYYNEIILVTAVGSLPIRTGRMFESGRKIGKTHQNVLVFVNGDPKKATEACGDCEFGEADLAEQESSEYGEEL